MTDLDPRGVRKIAILTALKTENEPALAAIAQHYLDTTEEPAATVADTGWKVEYVLQEAETSDGDKIVMIASGDYGRVEAFKVDDLTFLRLFNPDKVTPTGRMYALVRVDEDGMLLAEDHSEVDAEVIHPANVPMGEEWIVDVREGVDEYSTVPAIRTITGWKTDPLHTPLQSLWLCDQVTLIERVPVDPETEPLLPDPADVPEGERWLVDVKVYSHEYKCVEARKGENGWRTDKVETPSYTRWLNHEVTLISRIEPEPKPAQPAHPEWLETEQEYRDALEETGTIVAANNSGVVYATARTWRNTVGMLINSAELAGTRRKVLRWGWSNEADC